MNKQTVIIGAIILLLGVVSAKATTEVLIDLDYRHLRGFVPRGISNNNPFNIKISSRAYDGKVPKSENTDLVHEQFINWYYGIAAGVDHLRKRYILGQNSWGVGKLDTIRKIINVYAPSDSGEGNQPNVYSAYLSRKTGIGVDYRLDANNKEQLHDLTRAMLIFENGAKYESSYLSIADYSPVFDRAWHVILGLS